jgi:hypothetical protein
MPNTHAMRFTALPKGLQDVTLVPDDDDEGPGGPPTEDRPPVLFEEEGNELDPIELGDPVVQPVVSAHVAFRLTPDAVGRTLNDFPTALDWPNQPIDWTLTFRRGDRVESFPALVVSDDPVADWWSTIFRPGLPVRGYVPPTNRTQRRIRSFRQTRLANRWRDAYVNVAQSIGPDGDHLPVGVDPTTGLFAAFESVGLWDERRAKDFDDEQLVAELESTLAGFGFVPDTPPPGLSPAQVARRDILEFRRYLTRVRNEDPPDTELPEPDVRLNRISWVRPPQVDFHQLTTACAAHAALLRPLRLVVDLVPNVGWQLLSLILGGYPDAVSVFGRSGSFTTDPSPWTRCTAGANRFALTPGIDSDLTGNGFLRLGDTARYSTETLDVEATTLKAIGLGGTVQLRNARRSLSTPTTETTPTMRASGIAVTRIARSQTFHETAFQKGDLVVDKLNTDPNNLELDADDVLRGYRLDVQPEGSANWRSVVIRDGQLDVDGGDAIPLDTSEGWVSEVPVADDAGDLYLGEEQLRWDGWSPVAPKPGRLIDPEDQVADATPDPLPGVPVVARYRPTPGTLVPLRYGRRYRLRARMVDIAGNGPELDAPFDPAGEQTAPVLFGRLDPVGSPDVVMTAQRLPGEELNRVVLRSTTRDVPAEGPAGRHLLPPRSTQVEVERHGAIDDAAGRPDPSRFGDLATRDAYTLHLDPRSQVDPAAVDSDDEGAARYVPIGTPLSVDYLPDPLARRLQLRSKNGSILPGDAARGIPIGGRNWPEANSVLLVIEEADSFSVGYDADNSKLVVRLPKATTLPLRLSSVFEPEDLTRFGLAEWVARKVVPNAPDWPRSAEELAATPLGQRIVDGLNWTFTPWQTLTLVHAVKDPLRDPEIISPAAFTVIDRLLAETSSPVTVPARWHGTSTGRLDLLASWTAGIDDGPGTPRPRRETVQVVATELDRAGTPGADGLIESSIRTRHDHGDTKYRVIDYSLEATGAFLDHFTETRTVEFPDGVDGIELDVEATGIALGTVRLSGPIAKDPGAAVVTFRRDDGTVGDDDEPVAYAISSAPGDTKAKLTRIGGVIPSDTPLTLRYVTNPISHRSNMVRRTVKASARPAAPIVHSVIPTFGWERSRSGNTATSTRTTAGVRIWLERPWWSSGLGEQLAVLYRTGNTQPVASERPFVSQWGRDPIHAAGNVVASMTDAAFPARLRDPIALRPPGGPIVRAVPHVVRFNVARDMWYCDVDLELGAYWPFVRLALARWQPNAIVAADPPGTPGDTALSLSPVVLADIVQVAPGRTATVTASGRIVRAINVVVQGPSFSTTAVDRVAPVVRAHLERQPLRTRSDVDWEPLTNPENLTRTQLLAVPTTPERTFNWQGTLQLGGVNTTQYRYRVVIEEFEQYRTDGEVGDLRPIVIPGRPPAVGPYPRDGQRLVHLDVIPLDGFL